MKIKHIISLLFIIVIILFIISVIKSCKEPFMDLPFEVKFSDKIKSRGLFATRDIKKGEIIETCPSLLDKDSNWGKTVANDYVFEYNNTDSALVLGYCSMLNHSDNPNIDYEFKDKDLVLTANRNINKGEELFNSYGDHWWESRDYKKI